MGTYLLILAFFTALMFALGYWTNLLRDPLLNPAAFQAIAAALNISNPRQPYSLARCQLAFWTAIILSSFFYLWLKYPHQIPGLNNVNLILLGIAAGTTATGSIIDQSQKNLPNRSQDHPNDWFLMDIFSDKDGVSIHRLQNVLWTIIVGIIYIHFVATGDSLPDDAVITTNLLILMGISTGAYVGLKTMENT